MACCAACVWLAACSDDDYEPLPDWWWEQTGEPAVYPEPEPVDNKVVAHRGCYAETGFPQNSVAGLKKAVEMTGVEAGFLKQLAFPFVWKKS